MSIVQTTDFTLNQSLPIDVIGNQLQVYINKYEPKILSKVLGYQLYKEFKAAIDAGAPIDAKWTNLRDGAEYTYNSIPEYFDGVKVIVVNYIYFKFIKENSQHASGVGIKRVNSENSENADPSYKMQLAYNEMVDVNELLYEFITAKNAEVTDTYEDFIPCTFEKITHFGF